ncbi:SNF2 family N-terminal domain-containing protein [Truncatella angustata]|uniref:DNA helicase n=1 Tax=Truncatella angustata TaxID=152316 RepID=A0A9P8USI2_9PEZI|nr:SNF2 family N-terminal domain-containing protein [Truncatella angustata]KAH6657506.1 SNF2 family N-terminal domain-containing protein [Truncatella angustata]
MTDIASPPHAEAAPAHDNGAAGENGNKKTNATATAVTNGKPELDPIDTSPVNNPHDPDSDSDLTPIKSDDDDAIDQSLSQDASTLQRAHQSPPDQDRPAKRPRLSTPPSNSQSKKPKPISPPWKRFQADKPTTIVTEDGKRRSGRTLPTSTDNVVVANAEAEADASTAQVGAADVKQPISPPWKRFEAQIPTTFVEDGKRRSGRTNLAHLDSPEGKRSKRPARGTLHEQTGTPAGNRLTNGHPRSVSSSKATPAKTSTPTSKSKPASNKKAPVSSSKSAPKVSNRRRSPPPPPVSPQRTSARQRSSRNLRGDFDSAPRDSYLSHQGSPRSTRIKLRVRATAIPIVHPGQVNVFPGQTVARPKLGENFADYVQKASNVDIRDGGWQDPTDDAPVYTEEQAEADAKVLLRVEDESRPGGILSEERCALFVPDPAEEPARQWAHYDHLVRAATNFRKLLVKEHYIHKQAAKRLAEACRDEWIRRQPKSAEQIEAEARILWIARYKSVVRALVGTWENVRLEINRRRLEEFEAKRQREVKAALNEAVNMSELKLQARRAHFDSEAMSSDEDEEEDMEDIDAEDDGMDSDDASNGDIELDRTSQSSAAMGEDADNMSSSDDEEDAKSVTSDAELDQEQLRQKYANIPDLPQAQVALVGEDNDDAASSRPLGDETSDESVDMDDDMGSSDEGMDSEDEEESESASVEEDGEEEEEPTGLLGMLFGKSELKKLQKEAPADESQEITDVSMADVSPSVDGAPTTNTNGYDASEDASNSIQPNTEQVDAPRNPYQANKPDAPATVPEPLQPGAVQKEVIETVEQVQNDSPDVPMADPDVESPAVTTTEVAVAPNTANASPGTDGATNSASRDDSQSPRTSDTKASEIDSASSAMQVGASRSVSPSAHVPKTEIPFLLRGTLREYQHFGLDWLAGLYQNKTNGILADEMGLGKTIQTISLLAHLACHHGIWGPHLVIVPTSVMLNWEMEFKKFFPGFKVLSYYGSIEERKRKRQGWQSDDMWNVCVTSYQIVLQDHQVFKRRRWHYMILDEAHNIKNFQSKRWQTLLGFNTQARLLLTGTPLQNNLTELWSLLFFLMPSENGVGGFADLAEFHEWFRKPESQILESGREQMDDEARAIIAKLHKVLRPYLLRRLKADVEKQMPAKYEHVEFCRLSRRQRELYDGFLARTDTREALASGNYISVINCLMQLRKVCNHPDLFVERPIMTSFRQRTSVIGEYAFTNHLLKDKLLAEKPMRTVSLRFLNFLPTHYEDLSLGDCHRVAQLTTHHDLMGLREIQKQRAEEGSMSLDPSTVESNIIYLESASRWRRFEELQHSVYLNALRRQQQPVYGKRLRDFLTIDVSKRPFKPRPKVPAKVMAWFEEDSTFLRSAVLNLDQRAESMKTTISKFACITPAVITRDIDQFVLGSKGVNAFTEADLRLAAPVRYSPFMPKEVPLDPWHEARMRLSIQFPDKRLLQYDCGKLQVLDKLLRKLQSGGHRALIFTQMTKVLDLLEQFLNIHGHKYLRLDGATKVEQRQILTDRFNNDPRILCFILSTRSGGLGINLTGADTVIFYDQDWNPAMDKQCQDRCHRIGQTRDVHIYRLVSEHTIEANILRKASQKQMLDDVVIQEGGFTTDYFNKVSVHDALKGADDNVGEDVVGDAMDRVLGTAEQGGERAVGRVLEQAEDREDVAAAHVAEKEIREDDADFDENAPTASASGTSSARQGTPATRDASAAPGRSNLGLYEQSVSELAETELNAWGEQVHNIDEFMMSTMTIMLEGTPLEIPKDKKKGKNHKKGKDHRKR